MNSDKVNKRVLRDMKLLMKNELYQADVIDTKVKPKSQIKTDKEQIKDAQTLKENN